MENQLYIALQSNKLFLDIDLKELDLSEIKGELKPLKEGEILFREENISDRIYLVASGEINVLKKKLLGSTKSFIFDENDFFGYDEIAEDTSRTSTAVALRDCYLISFTKDEIEKLVEQNHMIKTNLLNYSDIEPLIDGNEIENEIESENEIDSLPKEEIDKKADVTSFEQSLKDDLIDKHDLINDKDASVYEEDIDNAFDKVDSDEVPKNQAEQNLSETKAIPDEPLFPDDEENDEDFLKLDNDTLAALSSQENENQDENESIKPKLKDFDDAFFMTFNTEDKINTEPKEPNDSELAGINESEAIQQETKEQDKSELSLDDEPVYEETFEQVPGEKEENTDEQNISTGDTKQQAAQKMSNEYSDKTNTKLQSDQLKKIIKAAQLVNSNIKIDDVLKNIITVATDLTNAERGTLYLIDKEKNELWSKIAMGNETKEIRLDMGEGIAGWVAQNRETVNIEDVSHDERFKSEYDRSSGYETKNMLCFPLKDREDEIVGVIQLLNNKSGKFTEMDEEFLSAISIQCSLALQNAEMLEKLLQTERVQSLGKMTNFLIQDIKKPVLVSKRYTEHLKSKELNKDAAQIVEMILEQLTQVADLVQTTSSYSEGKAVLRASRVSLNEILNEFGDRLDSYVKSRSSIIVNKLEKDARVNLDSKEFFQCYNHLIRNACDAMPDGGQIEVSTRLTKEKDFIVISIKDQGLGIPDSLVDKCFDPFMTHGKKDGTGLGLTITKKIVESHSGKIEVESNLGEGATFIITLPITSSL